MGWRKILEAEHRLMREVADAADNECDHIAATGVARADLVGDILGFFRFFCDGLHDPKENDLLFARCHKRGMTNDDEPLEQMLGEHEWCAARLDRLQVKLRALPEGDGGAARAFAADLREYVEVVRCHMEVEETVFFDTAQHYLTETTGVSSPRSSRRCTTTRSTRACKPTGRSSPTGSPPRRARPRPRRSARRSDTSACRRPPGAPRPWRG